MDVLFVRYRPFVLGDTEWAEPIAVCCAFDCRTTLLLLDEAARTTKHVAATLNELQDLDIATICATAPSANAAVTVIDLAAAQALMAAHTRVLTA